MVRSLDTAINDANSPARLQESPEQIRLDSVPELDGKRITIAVFNSGKIIITGGKTMEQLTLSYRFINSILQNKKKYMIK